MPLMHTPLRFIFIHRPIVCNVFVFPDLNISTNKYLYFCVQFCFEWNWPLTLCCSLVMTLVLVVIIFFFKLIHFIYIKFFHNNISIHIIYNSLYFHTGQYNRGEREYGRDLCDQNLCDSALF